MAVAVEHCDGGCAVPPVALYTLRTPKYLLLCAQKPVRLPLPRPSPFMALDWEGVSEMRTLLIDDTSTFEEQQMQLSDFPRFYQRGLQATYFTWPARVTFRQLLLPQHHWLFWLSGCLAPAHKKAARIRRLWRPTVSSRQPPVYGSVSQHGNGEHRCCCCFCIACLHSVDVCGFFIRRNTRSVSSRRLGTSLQ